MYRWFRKYKRVIASVVSAFLVFGYQPLPAVEADRVPIWERTKSKEKKVKNRGNNKRRVFQ